jgi:hypothetical protein
MSTAHILGKSAPAIFDNQQPTCRISRRFACLLMIPESTKHVSLPVNADMGSGYLTSVVDLKVDDQLTSELVLGKDWISYYREYLISEGVMSPICPQNEQRSGNAGVSVSSLLAIPILKVVQSQMLNDVRMNLSNTLTMYLNVTTQ